MSHNSLTALGAEAENVLARLIARRYRVSLIVARVLAGLILERRQ